MPPCRLRGRRAPVALPRRGTGPRFPHRLRNDAALRAAIGERSDAVLRTATGERSDAVLRTAMGARSDAVLRTAVGARAERSMSTVKSALAQKSGALVHVRSGEMVVEALLRMRDNRVRSVLVIDDGVLVG